MADGDVYDFLMTLPCFVVELETGGMVSIPLDEASALVVLTDEHVAERFANIVSTARNMRTVIMPHHNCAVVM